MVATETQSERVKLTIATAIETSAFLEEFKTRTPLAGVFMLENTDGKCEYVGSSENVVSEIIRYFEAFPDTSETMKNVRVQTFSLYLLDAIDAYKNELIRITQPIRNSIPVKSSMQELTPTATEPTKSDSILNRLQILKNAVSNNLANTPKSSRVIEFEVIKSPFDRSTQSIQPQKTVNSATTQVSAEASSIETPIKLATCENTLDFTIENLNIVLDEVRPYLQADGGDVEVVSIDKATREVKLVLQGACGTCPSSTTTMKMGIERVLKENFVNLGQVVAITAEEAKGVGLTKAKLELTTEKVQDSLQNIAKAIKGLGGKVELLSVNERSVGEVRMYFDGPARLKKGLELVLKDVPGVETVSLEAFPTASS